MSGPPESGQVSPDRRSGHIGSVGRHAMAPNTTTETAYRAVYERHFDDIARYCLRRLPESDAHDAVADVFLAVWRRFDAVPDGDGTLPWLYGIARNVVRNSDRSQRRRLRLSAKVMAQPRYPAPSPEAQVVRNEEDAALLEALGGLKPDDQEVLRLRSYERLTMAEISLVLGCSEEAAKKRVSRALGRLRKAASVNQPVPAGSGPRAKQEGGER